MTARTRKLLDEALRLSLEERAGVAAELLDSLDGAQVEAAWAVEIERRAQGVLGDQAKGKAWPELRHELETHLLKN